MSRNHYPLNTERLHTELNGQPRPRCPGTGKVAYTNRAHAETARDLIRGDPRHGPITPTGVNRCGNHWHLTSRTRAQQKRRRGRR